MCRYIDETVCICSIGWSRYHCTHLFQWCRCILLTLWWWVHELSDALSNSSLSTMPWVLTRQTALPGFQTLIGADINGHRTKESENLHTSRCSWKFPTIWSAPLVALRLECIRQIWYYVVMNRSCFIHYFLPDAGKMAHVQTTVSVWSNWKDMHRHSGERGPDWRRESSCRRILNLRLNGYFNTYIAGITSFNFHHNNGCIGFIILQNI